MTSQEPESLMTITVGHIDRAREAHRKAAAFDRLVEAIERERAEAVELHDAHPDLPDTQSRAVSRRMLCDRLLGVTNDG